MTYNPDIHHRHSIRLRDYDYSQNGAYFVTLCAYQRECLFGEVGAGSKPAREWGMYTNEAGKLVEMTWHDLPNHNRNIFLDAFVVMPNHIHGILVIDGVRTVWAGLEIRAGLEPAPTEKHHTAHGAYVSYV